MTVKVTAVEVFNKWAQKPCRHCGHKFVHETSCETCSCHGKGVHACPVCGTPADEPLNSDKTEGT